MFQLYSTIHMTIESRFQPLQLKGEPINCTSTVTYMEVRISECHLKELFPSLYTTKLQKAYTSKVKEYIRWKPAHYIENQCLFMVRMCEDTSSSKTRVPRDQLLWLPSPLKDESGEHYVQYQHLKFSEVSDEKGSQK